MQFKASYFAYLLLFVVVMIVLTIVFARYMLSGRREYEKKKRYARASTDGDIYFLASFYGLLLSGAATAVVYMVMTTERMQLVQ